MTCPLRPWRLHRGSSWTRLWSLRHGQCKLSGSAAVPQLQFIEGRQHPCLHAEACRGTEAVSHGPGFSADHGYSAVQVQQVPQVQAVRRQSRSHSCSSSYSCLDNVVACPLCATTYAWWFGVQKTATVAQSQCPDTVRCPVHRYRAGGRVHRDTLPTIRCVMFGGMDRHVIKTH